MVDKPTNPEFEDSIQFELMIKRSPHIVDRESLAAIMAGDLQFAVKAFRVLGEVSPNLAEVYFSALGDKIWGRNSVEEEIIL